MSQTIPLNEVPKDHSERKIVGLYNPLAVDFTHKFDGEDQIVKSGEVNLFAENVAILLARHLAERIVINVAKKDRELLIANADRSEIVTIQSKPYPRFNARVADVAKRLIGDTNMTPPTREEILKLSSEEYAREKKVEVVETREDLFVGDTEAEEAPVVIENYKGMTRQEMQAEVKLRGIEISHLSKNVELSEALLLHDSQNA